MKRIRRLISALTYAITLATPGASTSVERSSPDQVQTATPVRILHVFADQPNTAGPLLAASDGSLYGTLPWGGPTRAGVVYRVTPDGDARVVHVFSGPDGMYPGGILLEGSDGAIYGTVDVGSEMNRHCGLFRVTSAGDFSFIYRFPDPNSAHFVASLRGRAGERYLIEGGIPCTFEKTESPVATPVTAAVRSDPVLAITELPMSDRYRPVAKPWVQAPVSEASVRESVNRTLGFSNVDCIPELPVKAGDGLFYGLVSCRVSPRSRCFVYRVESASKISLTHEFAEPQEYCRFPGPLVVSPDGRLYGAIFDYSSAHVAVFNVKTTATR
jgi:hypothetical protein